MRRSLFTSIHQAWRGFRYAFETQPHVRIEVAVFLFVFALCLALPLHTWERVSIAIVTMGVIVVELINTSIERLVDLVKPQWNEAARDAKEVAASAVCGSVLVACLVGILIFGPYLLFMIRHV